MRDDWEDCTKPTTIDQIVRWTDEEPTEDGFYWSVAEEHRSSPLTGEGVVVVKRTLGGLYYGSLDLGWWLGSIKFGPKLTPPEAP